MQQLQDIDEVNMFKDDHTVIHFRKPQSKWIFFQMRLVPRIILNIFSSASFSVRENLLVVSGSPETKSLKEMMPDILKQVGPQQYQFLKEQIGAGVEGKADAADDDDDDVPELVGTFEDVNKAWTVWEPV